MQIRAVENGVEIDGYVNAVERLSKPLTSRAGGQFRERICAGAFQRAIDSNSNILALLNHDYGRKIAETADGSLELVEDNIGLRARMITRDTDVIEKARRGDLVGWSFGFRDKNVDTDEEQGMLTRNVRDLELFEVSLLDREKTPAYDGTLVMVRSDDNEETFTGAPLFESVEVRSLPDKIEDEKVDYTMVDNIIKKMKGEITNE